MNTPFAALAAVAGACAALAGCAGYQPRPLDPQAEAAAFEARAIGPGPWRLAALQDEAAHRHPEAALAAARLQAADAAARAAGARPNPALSASAQQNRSAAPGTPAWTYGLGLDLPMETAGKRELRAARAAWLARAAQQAQAEALWHIRSRTREAYLAAYPLERETLERAALQQALAAARLPFDDLGPTALPEPAALATAARGALQTRPDVLAALADYEASQAALQIEIARQYPDLAIGPGYSWDAGALKWSLGLALSLPVFDRNQGPIAEAKARREEAAAAFRGVQEQAMAEIADSQAAYGQARRQLDLAARIAADQGARLHAATAAFEAGAIDRPALLAARLEASAADAALTESTLDAHRAAGRVEDALRRPLPSAPTKAQP